MFDNLRIRYSIRLAHKMIQSVLLKTFQSLSISNKDSYLCNKYIFTIGTDAHLRLTAELKMHDTRFKQVYCFIP